MGPINKIQSPTSHNLCALHFPLHLQIFIYSLCFFFETAGGTSNMKLKKEGRVIHYTWLAVNLYLL